MRGECVAYSFNIDVLVFTARKWINDNMGAILDKAGRVLLRRLDRLSEQLRYNYESA